MIEHSENKRITGWHEIAEAWGLSVRERERSASIKYAKRFFNKIKIRTVNDAGEIIYTKPIQKDARYVYTYQDILSTLKASYVFGKSDIANYFGIGVMQLSRNLKRYRGLKKIIMNPCGKFIYAHKWDLDSWKKSLKYSRLKNNEPKLREYINSQKHILRENLRADEERLNDNFQLPALLQYVIGKSDIAEYLGIGVDQLSMDLKRYRGLKKIIMTPPYGKYVFAKRCDLDNWKESLK